MLRRTWSKNNDTGIWSCPVEVITVKIHDADSYSSLQNKEIETEPIKKL